MSSSNVVAVLAAAKHFAPAFLFVSLTGYVLYLIGLCVYRLFFHPLAKYPGPLLAKVCDAHSAYHAWKGDIHLDMWRCHETYGTYVRYGPDRLLVNTAKGLKDVYGTGANVTKGKGYAAMVHRAHNTLTMLDKKEHGRRRRVMSQGFSDAAIRAYDPSIRAQVDKFCALLLQNDKAADLMTTSTDSSLWSTGKNMSQYCNYLAFDIMADVIFGREYDLLGKPDHRFVVEAIETSNTRISVLVNLPQLKLGGLDRWLFPEAIRCRNRFIGFVNRLLRDRMCLKEATPGRRDVFSILTTAYDPETGSGFRAAEVGAESTTLIVAGSDTSSTTLAGMFFYLSRCPRAYARVTEEVRRCFTSVDEIHMGAALASCTYLRACMDESMRLSPSVGSALWREVLPGGLTVDGQYLPAGCEAATAIYSIHHHADYYAPDPFTFRPERWIVGEDGSTRESVAQAQAAFNPFSIGPRGCIGKGLAIAEVGLTMATLLWTLDFRLADGADGRVGQGASDGPRGRCRADEFQLRDHITSAKNGPVLRFRRRKVE